MTCKSICSFIAACCLICFSSFNTHATILGPDTSLLLGKAVNVTIDGKPDDWNVSGLKLNILSEYGNFNPSAKDFSVRCRFGWDERGLLLLAIVHDDVFTEAGNVSDIWRKDGIEFFMAESVGSSNRLQLLIAPGMDPKHPEPRFHLNLQSTEKPENLDHIQPQIARTKTEDGFILEALIPWQLLKLNLPLRTLNGVALQIYFNDVDNDSSRGQMVWYPSVNTYSQSTDMYTVRFSGSGSECNIIPSTRIEYLKWLVVDVKGIPELSGQNCRIASDANLRNANGQNINQTQKLLIRNGYARATFRIPIEIDQLKRYRFEVSESSSSHSTYAIQVPNTQEIERDYLLTAGIRFEPSTIFQSSQLPECHFEQPLVMAELLGEYDIHTRYFDADCCEVTQAERPGRYGAVIKITSSKTGKTHTRYRTLYRMPENVDPWDMTFGGDIQLPMPYGIDPDIVKNNQKTVNEFVNWSFWDVAKNASHNAGLLASLSEMKPDTKITVYNGVATAEKQYWTKLERKLNQNDTMFVREFQLPQQLSTPAPAVLEGTMSEARMTDDAPQKIDAVLTEWANDTDEPFIACVIRNGVIVHHKAYGKRDDKPMTTQTKSWMASLSKLISGTMVMMMLDQKLVNLDMPIDRYLPELQNAGFNKMPTIRNLWTHTAGLTSHRGEDDPDLEHLIASIAPYVKVGNKYEYDGMGLELGIQLLAQVSGKCYPLMVKEHLLDPLGCSDTDCQNASWNTQSTALNMAIIGQMLLNGGSYGSHRFMSEATRDAMLPIDMSILTEGQSTNQYGIGTSWYTGDGLSDRCFAHGAASSATLRIDLKHNLVISMTRNAAGKNFGKYHPRFIQTVTGCMLENQRVER
jgi:CubicO group peptidase (beta-lactamase class C family)